MISRITAISIAMTVLLFHFNHRLASAPGHDSKNAVDLIVSTYIIKDSGNSRFPNTRARGSTENYGNGTGAIYMNSQKYFTAKITNHGTYLKWDIVDATDGDAVTTGCFWTYLDGSIYSGEIKIDNPKFKRVDLMQFNRAQ